MGGLFGGGGGDDGAGARAIAEANLQASREAAASAERQQKMQQDQISKDKADALFQQNQQDAKRQADIEAARKQQADQQKAQQATGASPSFEDTRSDSAKALAIQRQTGNNASLPGFNALANRVGQNDKGGFAGQSNSLQSQPGAFNSAAVGGRRYV